MITRLLKFALLLLLAVSCMPAALAQTCVPGGGLSCTPNLGLSLPPKHYLNWDVPMNANSNILDTWSATVVSQQPTASQTIATPLGFSLNLQFPLVYSQASGVPAALKFGPAPNSWDSAISRTAAGKFSFDTGVLGNGLGVPTAAGYQVNGGAAAGTILCGNGSSYVSCPASSVAAFYQTYQSVGTALTQRPAANFSAAFTLADQTTATGVDLATQSGLAAGTYANPLVTVNGKGVLTAISSGSAVIASGYNNATTSRACGVTYQNTNAYALVVSIESMVAANSGATMQPFIGSSSASNALPTQSVLNYGNTTPSAGSLTFIVPASWYYLYTRDVTCTFSKWVEYPLH